MFLHLLVFLLSISTTVASTNSVDSIRDYLSLHFQPIFQETFEQLTALVFQFAQQLFNRFPTSAARTSIFPTAPWVSDLFGGMNTISTQWNQHLSEFFSNIQTTIEHKGRSSISVSSIELKLQEALKHLLVKLEDFFVNEVHLLLVSLLMKYQTNTIDKILPEFNRLLLKFRSDVSMIFNQRGNELFGKLNQIIDAAVEIWDDFKDLIVG